TAGVYMVVRAGALFVLAPTTLLVIACVGAATALFAATIGLVQNDIKRVLAYSTVSQLGYMFLALGVGAFSAGIFHLFTHAFFKACLFLGSGSVIHAMGGEQDMRKMGGLRPHMPMTYWTFLVSTVAIAGIPPLAGFVSKDEILWKTLSTGHFILYGLGLAAAACTAFYMFRLVFMTFSGECRADEHAKHHLHESPAIMTLPLLVLAVFAAVAGLFGWPHALGGANAFHHWLEPVLAEAPVREVIHSHAVEYVAMAASVGVALAGIFLAYSWYGRRSDAPTRAARRMREVYETLLNKYYVDELYNAVFVRPILGLSRGGLWKLVDEVVIDGLLVNGVGKITALWSRGLSAVQSGKIQLYAGYMLVGALLMGYLVWR
ncbi:MAG: NADH-quinone oxidoreductase subunit L, partial [Candidatus Methylomirabilis sp.]|nr:NADH-quinone oxidoreductase subunit L [Deltaproteobacteria bacterium]